MTEARDGAAAATTRAPVGSDRPLHIRINGAFRGQRVTGQQRYAGEMAEALVSRALPEGWTIDERRPPRPIENRRLLTWLWVQTLSLTPRDHVLLSFTSRAPVLTRNHVSTVHDTFVLTHPEWYRRAYRWSHALLQRLQLRTSRALIAVSGPVADQVAHAARRGAVVIVPNAPSRPFIAPPTRDLDPRLLRVAVAGTYLLAVGSKDPRKNLARLLSAYGRLPEPVRRRHPLLLAGDDGGFFAQDASVKPPVGTTHVGYVSDDELAHLYRNARAVALVSLDEGFGLPVVEAISCGATLVASDIPVLRWVAGDGPVYVDPLDEVSIAHGLLAAVEAGRRPDAEAKAEDIRARFNWDRSADTLLRFLAEASRRGELR